MSDREPPDHDLPDEVAQLAGALRAGVPVRAEWREELLRGIEATPAPGKSHLLPLGGSHAGRRLVLSPFAAAAAALICVALGAAGALTLIGTARNGDPGAGAPAAATERDVHTIADARTMGIVGGGGTSVRFVIVAPNAARVSVVGNFNGWDPGAAPMERLGGGDAWIRELVLEPGRHAYAFFVDGAIQVDPSAPRAAEDDFGIPSSALVVRPVPQ
jgi:hypothetical protein